MNSTNQDKIEKTLAILKGQKWAVADTENQLKTLRGKSKIGVTDHAFKRFVERELPEMYHQIMQQLTNNELHQTYTQLGDGTYPITGTGAKAVIKGGIILTIKI